MNSIQDLLAHSGQIETESTVEAHVRYVETEKLDLQDIVSSFEFEDSLREVIMQIETNIELRAIDQTADCVAALRAVDQYRDDLVIAQADYILLSRGPRNVVALRNKKFPKSGCTVCVDFNTRRLSLARTSASYWPWIGNNWRSVSWLTVTLLTVSGALILSSLVPRRRK
jgi:hypothetical protein